MFFNKIERRGEVSSYDVELHLMLLPKNVQNTFDADNGIIKSTYKIEVFQILLLMELNVRSIDNNVNLGREK